MQAAASGIQGAATLGQMYYDVLSEDYDQAVQDAGPGMETRANIAELSDQEFEKEGFKFSSVASGAGAGAAIGAALAPVTAGLSAPIGVAAGAIAGAGAELIRLAKQRKAEKRFNEQRQTVIAGALQKNQMIDVRRMAARNLGVSLQEQYNMFY